MKLLAQYVRSSLNINEKVIRWFYWPLVARIVSVSRIEQTLSPDQYPLLQQPTICTNEKGG